MLIIRHTVAVLVVGVFIAMLMATTPAIPKVYIVIPQPLLTAPSQIATAGWMVYESDPGVLLVNNDNYHKRPVACAVDNTGLHCWGNFDVRNPETVEQWVNTQFSKLDIPTTNPSSIDVTPDMICVIDSLGTFCQFFTQLIYNKIGMSQDPGIYPLTNFSNPSLIRVISGSSGTKICVLSDIGIECEKLGYNEVTESITIFDRPTALDIQNYFGCGVDSAGAQCWNVEINNQSFQFPVPTGITNPTQIGVGLDHACVLDALGVKCWGDNSDHANNVPLLNNPFKIAVGASHSCALDENGAQCWGSTWRKGNSPLSSTIPVVPTLSNPIDITAGDNSTCAIDDTGVVCW